MSTLENIIAQIEAYRVSNQKIRSQWVGIDQIWFEIKDVSISDFNALVERYNGRITYTTNGKAFIQIANHDERYLIVVWSVKCQPVFPKLIAVEELQTA